MECGVQSTRAPQPWTKHYRVTIIAEWITAKRKRQMSSFSLGLLCVWGSRTHYYLYFQQKQSRAQTDSCKCDYFFFFFTFPKLTCEFSLPHLLKRKLKKNIGADRGHPHAQESQWEWRHFLFPLRGYLFFTRWLTLNYSVFWIRTCSRHFNNPMQNVPTLQANLYNVQTISRRKISLFFMHLW